MYCFPSLSDSLFISDRAFFAFCRATLTAYNLLYRVFKMELANLEHYSMAMFLVLDTFPFSFLLESDEKKCMTPINM